MNRRLIDGLSIFAVLVGTFRVIGGVSGIWILTDIGQTLAISPAPSPYTYLRIVNPDDYSQDLSFGCEDAKGKISWHRWDYNVRGNVDGPHRRTVTFFHYFGLIRGLRKEADNKRLFDLTRYYFCNNGSLAQAAQCAPDLVAVLLRNHSSEGVETANLRVACSR